MKQIVWYPFNQTTGQVVSADVDLNPYLEREDGVLWVDIEGITPEDELWLKSFFAFEHLHLEDCVHPQVIPKLEEFPDYLFIVTHGVNNLIGEYTFELQELDLFLGKHFLVTVHARPLPSIHFVQAHLARGTSAIHGGVCSLAHEILDALADTYLPFLELLDARLSELEEILEKNPGTDVVTTFFELRRSVLGLRRVAIRQQEVFYWLSHRDIGLISKKDTLLFRDIYDHFVRIVELNESARDILSGMLNIHLSLMSNRMNDVMRVLTIYSTILMPLTFIVGVYGMNFDHMPELHLPYAYPAVLMLMASITVGMLLFFKHKRWL
jgi:magnesium transporter